MKHTIQYKSLEEANPIARLFTQYIQERKFGSCLSDETLRGYEAVFKLFLKVMPELTYTKLLTPSSLIQFFKRIQDRSRIVGKDTIKTGVKKSTIKTQWSKLHVFFVWLEKNGHIQQNPLRNIRPPTVNYDDLHALSDNDIHKIYSSIIIYSRTPFTLRRDTVMVSLLLYCGLRKGEFISLRVSDIDLQKRDITIRADTSKSKRQRIIKIHPTLLMHLQDYFKERKTIGYVSEQLVVSTAMDRGLTAHGLKKWVVSLVKKSGVKFHLHCFRHTFASKLAEADVHPFKIQKMMGHTSLAMTMKYVRSLRSQDMEDDILKIHF